MPGSVTGLGWVIATVSLAQVAGATGLLCNVSALRLWTSWVVLRSQDRSEAAGCLRGDLPPLNTSAEDLGLHLCGPCHSPQPRSPGPSSISALSRVSRSGREVDRGSQGPVLLPRHQWTLGLTPGCSGVNFCQWGEATTLALGGPRLAVADSLLCCAPGLSDSQLCLRGLETIPMIPGPWDLPAGRLDLLAGAPV